MNTPNVRTICLLDRSTGAAALVSVGESGAEILKANGKLARTAVSILTVAAREPSVRFETFAPGEIGVGRRPVKPGDQLYAQGLVEAFEKMNLEAVTLDPKRAAAWWLVQTLPLERDESDAICKNLVALTEEKLNGLLAALNQAAAELAEIDKKESALKSEIAAKRRKLLEEIKK